MIDLMDALAGWRRTAVADGFALLPPDDIPALVRVRERAPVRKLRAFVDEALREGGAAFAAARVGPVERFTTYEGEHAGLVTIAAAPAPGQQVERTLALVAGDDRAVVLDGITSKPDRFGPLRDLVRTLAETYFLGAGELRRRRYEYVAPAGWSGVARAHAVQWLSPTFPRVASFITVYEARPRRAGAVEVQDRALTMESTQQRVAELLGDVTTAAGLGGRLERREVVLDGVQVTILRATLSDDRFIYLAQLNATAPALEAATPVFRALVDSIRPVPAPRPVPQAAALHWID